MAFKNKPNEYDLTRIYNAPLKTVWQAWVDPQQVAKWWGPRGFTITNHSKDVRTGGHWDYMMHGPDGTNYPNKTKFLQVEEYSKMIYDHGANDTQPPLFRVTVLFTEKNGQTELNLTMAFENAEIATQMKKFIKQAGGDSTWDRLAEYLDETVNQKNTFVINRSFHTSVDFMYDMWTNPKNISAWLAPTGASMNFIKADIQTGGTTFWKMEGPHGVMFGKAKYLEMNQPNKIVYTQQFVDESENISRHPMAPTWPETMLTTVEFSAEDTNQTRVTVTWEPHGKTTHDELDTFKNARAGMTMGWTGSFDKLDDHIAKI
jgi:uncharacterized protein YndB with AHSA1/START domain